MSIEDVASDEVNIQDEPIDYEKFISCVASCIKRSPKWAMCEMQDAYNLFDKDDNGFVDPLEIRRVFYRIGEQISEAEIGDQLRGTRC